MRYAIVIDAVDEPGFPPGYFYVHVPALDLTTHGEGVEGAKAAARDLIGLWVEEKRTRGEHVPRAADSYFAHVEIDDVLLGA